VVSQRMNSVWAEVGWIDNDTTNLVVFPGDVGDTRDKFIIIKHANVNLTAAVHDVEHESPLRPMRPFGR
jgi:hypothetical protein